MYTFPHFETVYGIPSSYMYEKKTIFFFKPYLKMAIIVILGNMISNSHTRLQGVFGGVKRSSSGSSTRAVDKDWCFCSQPYCWCFMKWVFVSLMFCKYMQNGANIMSNTFERDCTIHFCFLFSPVQLACKQLPELWLDEDV